MLEAKTPEFMMMPKYEEVMAAGLVEEEGHEDPLEVLAEDLDFLTRWNLGIEPYIGCKCEYACRYEQEESLLSVRLRRD
jgi:hypothetical protein